MLTPPFTEKNYKANVTIFLLMSGSESIPQTLTLFQAVISLHVIIKTSGDHKTKKVRFRSEMGSFCKSPLERISFSSICIA